MTAKLSLIGLYNYDSSILDNLTLPSNYSSDELTELKNNLLLETSEFEVIYPDFEFLKAAIGLWCAKRQSTWKWLKDTQGYDYNPIWNADYNITDNTLVTRDLAGTNDTKFTRNLSEVETITQSATDEIDETDTIKNHKIDKDGNDTTTHSVYSYNQTSDGVPQYSDKTVYNSGTTENGTNTIDRDESHQMNSTRNLSQTGGTSTDNDTTDTGTINTDYGRYLRGNYGQTTTQEMIKQEQELAKINLIDFIIDEFKHRFCVVVY